MDLLDIWHDYRYLSKILFGTIHTPAYEVKVMREYLVLILGCFS